MKTTNETLFRHLMMAARRTRKEMHHGPEGFPPQRMGHGVQNLPAMGFMGPGPQVPPEFARGRAMRPISREFVLILISEHPDGIHQKEICEKMHINPSSVSELVDKLEDDGYIERRTDPNDRRATLLCLSEKGSARAAEVEDERNEQMEGLFTRLSEDEKKTLDALLVKMIGNDSEPEFPAGEEPPEEL